MEKKYFITTYGCQANIRDSEVISGMLEVLGMLPAASLAEADLLIVNTCSVRQASEDKVYGLSHKITNLKSQNPNFKVVLTGCLVGSATSARPRIKKKDLENRVPWVDFYLNINELIRLPDYLLKSCFVDEWAVKALSADSWIPKSEGHNGTAYINISQGCDNFCTFCVVPYARGKELSRSEEAILSEVRNAAGRGFSEIMLLGQNVNSWGLSPEKKLLSRKRIGEIPFAGLLRKVHEIKGIEKIKFITSNPFDFTSDLVETLKLPKIDRYLHLPVQSGDNEVLKKMGRRHTREDYLELVEEIRTAVPEIELGTDIIVGFPGETEAHFENTVDLFRRVRFNVAYISMYSPREGTVSARLYKDDVSRAEKRRRHARLTQAWHETKPPSARTL
ncbi:MAG: MiaB/RimO family radical SAM methylthiotransferase [Patescibacteria group bacterium]|nr:MiaB/RimO family radical SAM methylthiotransferase [Patescibacteria group bacterium]